jgi:hypothetical protein
MAHTRDAMTLDNALETLQVAIERLAQLAEDDGDSSLARRAENALQAVHETLRYAIILPSLKEMEEILNLSLDEWARFWTEPQESP